MAYIPVPNTAQVELVYNWSGQICQTVLHYVKASPWDITQLEEVAVACKSEFVANILPGIASTLSLIAVKATDLSAVDAETYTDTDTLPKPGLSSSPSLPNNCALVITKRTAKRGRSFRGRIYHPGLVETDVVNNTVNTGTVTTFVNAWTLLLSLTITADEANMCVVSRYANNAPRAEGISTLVTNLTSDGSVDSQRRRLPGRGA